jgi:hypothetical protein
MLQNTALLADVAGERKRKLRFIKALNLN